MTQAGLTHEAIRKASHAPLPCGACTKLYAIYASFARHPSRSESARSAIAS